MPIGRLFRTCSTGANTTITSSAIVANNYLRGREVIEHFDAFGESRFSGTDYAKFLGRLKLTVQVVEMSLNFFLNGFVSGYFRFKDQGVDAAESVIVRVLTADCLGVAGVFLHGDVHVADVDVAQRLEAGVQGLSQGVHYFVS